MTEPSCSATGVFSGPGADLLQQAFQQVVDDDEQTSMLQQGHEPEFVAYLQSDTPGDAPQIIQLTAELAAALGINITDLESHETNGTDAVTTVADDYQECTEKDQESQHHTLSHEGTQRIINELTQSGLLKRKDDSSTVLFDDWTLQQQQNEHDENYHQEVLESSLTLEHVAAESNSDNQQNQIEEQTSNFLHIQQNQTNGLLQKQNIPKSIETQCNGNVSQNTIQFSIASNNAQVDNIAESQTQILQRIPVILPSSQFIIKPTQTVLTPLKKIRILPSTNKVNSVQTSQNSLLMPQKTTLLNTISPQIIKTVPIGTQFLSTTNNISTQLLNTSQLIAKSSSSSNNQLINESLVTTASVNSVPVLTPSLIRQTSVQKPAQTQVQQKQNLQQFFTPLVKSSNAIPKVKNTSLLNSNSFKQSTSPILKSINPSQLLKTTLVKNPMTSLSLSKSTNSPVVFKTTPVLKTDDSNRLNSTTQNSLVRTQISSTPVSILKPQAKAMNGNVAKQNFASILSPKSSASKQIELSESLKPLVTAKLKQSMNSLMKSIKKKAVPQKVVTVKQESSDGNKPLGSSENPIQIVQQGDTFHSMHRLTPTQLKQIAQVLQQRTQESGNSNEKVVYRLVFPDDVDLKMKNANSLLKNRNGKRGRPKKSAVKTPVLPNKPACEEEQEDAKDDRKKIVARTRSGRLSRPPRHMVRDYKHLHHTDFTQPDMDDSDGGYSDYNTSGNGNNSKLGQEDEDTGQRTELLAGLEMPKRKISDQFRCPTCNKIYLGRTRMARHFEMHPDHGSPDQLPPPTVEAELKQPTPQDPLKRKGKKRGPWAYVTPEAKSERRQLKLREAISVCESAEIIKIAAKPVVDSLSLFELLLLKSDNNVRTFLTEVKELVERVREKTSTMLSAIPADSQDKLADDVVDLNEELLCDVLALNSGFYKTNESLVAEEPETEESHPAENFEIDGSIEPPVKMPKTESVSEEGKENTEERLSSGFSESSDLSVSDFFNDRKNESASTSVICPEVLSALTLMPRNSSASPESEVSTKISGGPKVLNSSIEIHTTDSPGFQKLSINAETKADPNFIKKGAFTKLGDNLDSNCTDVFTKINGNFDQAKMEGMQRTFIKLEPTEEGFIKLENGMIGGFHEEIGDFGKIQSNGFHYVSGNISDNFNGKGFRKLVPKPMSSTTPVILKKEESENIDDNSSHEVSENSIQITTSSSNGNSTDANIFESSENLDISKISYEQITHLDILNGHGVIDKNLMIDEKLVEHLQLVDNSNINIVDELVSERLKSIMPENILDSSLLQHNGNLDTELDFEELSEEFNRNTRS